MSLDGVASQIPRVHVACGEEEHLLTYKNAQHIKNKHQNKQWSVPFIGLSVCPTLSLSFDGNLSLQSSSVTVREQKHSRTVPHTAGLLYSSQWLTL